MQININLSIGIGFYTTNEAVREKIRVESVFLFHLRVPKDKASNHTFLIKLFRQHFGKVQTKIIRHF